MLLSLALLLLVVATDVEGSAPSGADAPALPFAWNGWERVDPPAFIELLRTRPERTLYLHAAPAGWVTAAHLPALVDRVGSTVPAAATCALEAAHMPPATFRSTVGQEAARIVEAFRLGWRYPGNCSDLRRVDPDAIRDWWRARSRDAVAPPSR